jgi:hypothetical protein
MLPLLRLDLLLPEFPPFMLDVVEVVNYPAKSSKYVATQNKQEPDTPAQNCRNQTVWCDKLAGPVLLRPTAVRGAIVLRRGAPPPAK